MGLFGNADVAANISVVAMTQQERIATCEHFTQPAQNVSVIYYLMLYEFLRDTKQNLRTTRPKTLEADIKII